MAARRPAAVEGCLDGHPDGQLPVPMRITLALGERYGPQVDRDLGGKEPMVDRWEDGTLIPSPAQVERLAAYTGYPVDWFYTPIPPATGTTYICTRRRIEGRRCHRIDGDPPPAPPPAVQTTLF